MNTGSPSRLTLGIFYGHQFHSSVEDSSTTRPAIREAVERTQESWNRRHSTQTIRLSYQNLHISSGSSLFLQVLHAIDAAEICIFNLTEKNDNVIFELGHAHGRDKELIWLCSEETPLRNLPSDFQGQFVLRYDSADALQDKLEGELQRRIERLWNLNMGRIAFEEIWDLSPSSDVDMIFGRIPADEASKYTSATETNYLRYQAMADIDTLVFFNQLLARNFPHIASHDWMSDEFTESNNPRLVVGGPTLNSYAAQYYNQAASRSTVAKLPIRFDTAPETGEEVIVIPGDDGETVHQSRRDKNSGFVFDVGIFAKFADPLRVTPVYVVAGISTLGVLGAAKCFSDTEQGLSNCDWIRRHDPDLRSFLAVFSVRARRVSDQLYVETPSLAVQRLLLNPLE